MDCYTGLLKIASGTQIPIKEKDIVYVILSNSQEVCLGDVIYILGLVERLLSLEVLYITRFKSRGTAAGYQLLKDNKVVVWEKQAGWSIFLNWVEYRNTLIVNYSIAKRLQYTQIVLSIDKLTAKKQELIHHYLGYLEEKMF